MSMVVLKFAVKAGPSISKGTLGTTDSMPKIPATETNVVAWGKQCGSTSGALLVGASPVPALPPALFPAASLSVFEGAPPASASSIGAPACAPPFSVPDAAPPAPEAALETTRGLAGATTWVTVVDAAGTPTLALGS